MDQSSISFPFQPFATIEMIANKSSQLSHMYAAKFICHNTLAWHFDLIRMKSFCIASTITIDDQICSKGISNSLP